MKKSIQSNTWGGHPGSPTRKKQVDIENDENSDDNTLIKPVIPKFRGLTADLKKYSFPKSAVMESDTRAKQCKNGIPFAKIINDQSNISGPLFEQLKLPNFDNNDQNNQKHLDNFNAIPKIPGYSMISQSNQNKNELSTNRPQNIKRKLSTLNENAQTLNTSNNNNHNHDPFQTEIKGDELTRWHNSFANVRDQLNNQLQNVLAANKLDRIEVYQSPELLASVTKMSSQNHSSGLNPNENNTTKLNYASDNPFVENIMQEFVIHRFNTNQFYDESLDYSLREALWLSQPSSTQTDVHVASNNNNNNNINITNNINNKTKYSYPNQSNKGNKNSVVFSSDTVLYLEHLRNEILEFECQSHQMSLWTMSKIQQSVINELDHIINDHILQTKNKDDKTHGKLSKSKNNIGTSNELTFEDENDHMHMHDDMNATHINTAKSSSITQLQQQSHSPRQIKNNVETQNEFYRELLIFADRIFGLNVPPTWNSNSKSDIDNDDNDDQIQFNDNDNNITDDKPSVSNLEMIQLLATVEMSKNGNDKIITKCQQNKGENKKSVQKFIPTSSHCGLPHNVLDLIVHIRDLLQKGHTADESMFYHCFVKKGQLTLQDNDLLQIFRFMRSFFQITEDELTDFMFKMGWHLSPSAKEFLMKVD